jgi:hypothetical protein
MSSPTLPRQQAARNHQRADAVHFERAQQVCRVAVGQRLLRLQRCIVQDAGGVDGAVDTAIQPVEVMAERVEAGVVGDIELNPVRSRLRGSEVGRKVAMTRRTAGSAN